MSEYVFLVRFGTQQTLTPEQQKQNTDKWGKLIQQWTQAGIFVGSSLLTKPGFTISGPDRKIDQGFIADAQSRVVSAIRVVAHNLEAAVDLAKACPTLDFGGTVDVREVQPSPFQ